MNKPNICPPGKQNNSQSISEAANLISKHLKSCLVNDIHRNYAMEEVIMVE